ncbi:hypothetical protein D3C79_988110 [compost metagenome]
MIVTANQTASTPANLPTTSFRLEIGVSIRLSSVPCSFSLAMDEAAMMSVISKPNKRITFMKVLIISTCAIKLSSLTVTKL